MELVESTAPDAITVETSYRGPHIQLPIEKKHLEALFHAFQRGEVGHPFKTLERSITI